jgi:hypothetical protein
VNSNRTGQRKNKAQTGEKPKGKRNHFGRHRHRWDANINIDINKYDVTF